MSVRVAVAADDEHPLVDHVVEWLREAGHSVVASGPVPWPDAGRQVGQAVADGDADLGVVMCWTGTGVSIAANKVPGVRAALCTDRTTAEGARRWNDANVLAMGMRLTSATVAEEMLAAFIATPVDDDERSTIDRVE